MLTPWDETRGYAVGCGHQVTTVSTAIISQQFEAQPNSCKLLCVYPRAGVFRLWLGKSVRRPIQAPCCAAVVCARINACGVSSLMKLETECIFKGVSIHHCDYKSCLPLGYNEDSLFFYFVCSSVVMASASYFVERAEEENAQPVLTYTSFRFCPPENCHTSLVHTTHRQHENIILPAALFVCCRERAHL